ncbi:hypothetical protein EPN29_14145 [bacterium]|nr:MAG: hypothetical protein EPN29_14145 [bacterium]
MVQLEKVNEEFQMSDVDRPEHTHESREEDRVVIDEGMRRWYKSCPCCMSAAYPKIKFALDEEKYS